MADDTDRASELEEIERQSALAAMNLPSRTGSHRFASVAFYSIECEKCGAPIGVERLNALPDATLCIDCANLAERRNRAFASRQ